MGDADKNEPDTRVEVSKEDFEDLLTSHLSPIAATQGRIESSQKTLVATLSQHGEDIAVMKNQMEKIGDCSGNAKRIDGIEKSVDTIFDKKLPSLSNRIWALAIGIPAIIGVIVGIVVHVMSSGG